MPDQMTPADPNAADMAEFNRLEAAISTGRRERARLWDQIDQYDREIPAMERQLDLIGRRMQSRSLPNAQRGGENG